MAHKENGKYQNINKSLSSLTSWVQLRFLLMHVFVAIKSTIPTIMIQGTSIIQHAMMGTSILRCAMVLIYIQRLPLYLQEWI